MGKKKDAPEFLDERIYVFYTVRCRISKLKGYDGKSNTYNSCEKHTGRLKAKSAVTMTFISDLDHESYTVLNDFVEGTHSWNVHAENGNIEKLLAGIEENNVDFS